MAKAEKEQPVPLNQQQGETPVREIRDEPIHAKKPTLEDQQRQQRQTTLADKPATVKSATSDLPKEFVTPPGNILQKKAEEPDQSTAINQTSSANNTGLRSAEDKKRHSQKK